MPLLIRVFAGASYWICPAAQQLIFEPRSEKTGLLGFRPGPTQTRLYSYGRWLEA